MSRDMVRKRPPMFGLPREAAGGARVNVQWFDREHERALVGPHGHRFLELVYFERDGEQHSVGASTWEVRRGDLYLILPGEVHNVREIGDAEGWAVEFAADAVGAPGDEAAFLSWRTNPLLYPFVEFGGGNRVECFSVPEADRAEWSRRLSALDAELRGGRGVGNSEAARAHLTLILVEVARLAADVVGGMRARDEHLLAEVFAYVEKHYAEPISLMNVAEAVSLSSGYLTTAVRRRTGRTVVEWIAERRMAEARRLLAETDENIEWVGARVGYDDPTYFARRFRRAHGANPAAWRNANCSS